MVSGDRGRPRRRHVPESVRGGGWCGLLFAPVPVGRATRSGFLEAALCRSCRPRSHTCGFQGARISRSRWWSSSAAGRTSRSPAPTGSRTSTWSPTTGSTGRSASTAWPSGRAWPAWSTWSGCACSTSRRFRFAAPQRSETRCRPARESVPLASGLTSDLSFQVLISGAQVPISLEDLRSFTNYSGAWSLPVAHPRRGAARACPQSGS